MFPAVACGRHFQPSPHISAPLGVSLEYPRGFSFKGVKHIIEESTALDENKRIPDRRQTTRRACDILHDRLTTEEIQHLDRLMYSKFLLEDRRTHERRRGWTGGCGEREPAARLKKESPSPTRRNREPGKRTPDPAALACLKVFEQAPGMVTEALSGHPA